MIYGYALDLNGIASTMIVAADNKDELNKWETSVLSTVSNKTNVVKPGLIEYMTTPHLKGLKNHCIIVSHADEFQRSDFLAETDIQVIKSAEAIDYQNGMIEAQRLLDDPESAGTAWVDEHGKASISDIYGLTDDNDQWDKRTAEEKAEDLKNRAGNAKPVDNLVGESFSFNPNETEEDGLDINNITVDGGLVSVSATKTSSSGSGTPIDIKLTAEAEKELEDAKAKYSADIYQEKYKTALAEQGLRQAGLTDAQIDEVMTIIDEQNRDVTQFVVDLQRSGFDYDKFKEEQVKSVMVGDDHSRVDLAARTGMIIQNLRDAGFSDEIASQIMQSVDIEKCLSQQEYIEKLEDAVEKAIETKNYKAELNKARDEGRAFAEEAREFVNPFGDDDDDDDDDDDVEVAEVEEVIDEVLDPVEDPAPVEVEPTSEDPVDTISTADDILARMFGGDDDEDEAEAEVLDESFDAEPTMTTDEVKYYTREEAIEVLGLGETKDPQAALRKRCNRGVACRFVDVDGVQMVEIIKDNK